MKGDDKKKDSAWFLREVMKKLEKRTEELGQSLLEGEKEIQDMHEYYWENYTEMDQYGYENYDNRQALFHQVNANQNQRELRRRFLKMLDSPFFGRVDFIYEGEEEEELFYIGIGNFSERTGMTPLIYDWRAPVSGLFYDYDRGLASYEAPVGRLEGEITSKWQYKIKRGKMLYAFESDTKIDDEILQQELGCNGDVKLKNIISTIQKEQNAIIRNTKDKILVIQGTAGSGKTSVALHRIAYLLYHDRKNLKSSDILILSPNSVFSDYISHILPELGEEPIQEMSFDVFAYHELKDIIDDCEDKYQYLERRMRNPEREEEMRCETKQSGKFVGEIEGFLAELEDGLMEFHDVEMKGQKKTEREIIRLFYFKFQDIPLLSRMEAVMEVVTDEWETLWSRDLTEEEKAFLQKQFDSMYVCRDIYKIYGKLMENCGYEFPFERAYGERFLQYEDVFPMLYLKQRLRGNRRRQNMKHVVIDEMQDYSYIQYQILQLLFSCSMTILGDKAQTMEEKVRDVCSFLPDIFGRKIRKIVMNKSYRSTVEIARYARGLQKGEKEEPQLLERHGREVTEQEFDTPDELLDEILKQLSLGEGGFETAAILTMTQKEAKDIYGKLTERDIPASYVDRDSAAFKRGLTVTTFYLAKGLEFDQVFTVKGDEENPFKVQAEYICATRALHELYMFGRKKRDGGEHDSFGKRKNEQGSKKGN